MRCPTLSELPPPPPGKTGWPWTEESPQLPDTMPDGSPWPRVSIVTPSLNQGQFIEETIRSVLLQGYPDLEYIIIDGGSTDGSVDIIPRYERWLAYWVSEPDRGQADAIRKGFERSKGQILAWLNSDDMLLPSAVNAVIVALQRYPDAGLVYGNRLTLDEQDHLLLYEVYPPFYPVQLKYGLTIPQETAFWRDDVYQEVGGIDPSFQLAMDHDLFIRMMKIARFRHVARFQGVYRRHSQTKCARQLSTVGRDEVRRIEREQFGTVNKHYTHLERIQLRLLLLHWKAVRALWKVRWPLECRRYRSLLAR